MDAVRPSCDKVRAQHRRTLSADTSSAMASLMSLPVLGSFSGYSSANTSLSKDRQALPKVSTCPARHCASQQSMTSIAPCTDPEHFLACTSLSAYRPAIPSMAVCPAYMQSKVSSPFTAAKPDFHMEPKHCSRKGDLPKREKAWRLGCRGHAGCHQQPCLPGLQGGALTC